jgi:hypothetical protein
MLSAFHEPTHDRKDICSYRGKSIGRSPGTPMA